MPYKNKKQHTTVAVEKETLKKLDDYKIHPNQSYSEVIKNLLNSKKKEVPV